MDCLPEDAYIFIDETKKVTEKADGSEKSFLSSLTHRLEGDISSRGR